MPTLSPRKLNPVGLLIATAASALLLIGCGGLPLPNAATGTPPPVTPTESATLTPTVTPTPTALPPLLVLLAPPEADPALADALDTEFARRAQEAGFRFQIRQTISAEETAQNVDYLIALPPAPDLQSLVAAAPATRFLAAGVPGLVEAPNLIAIGANPTSPDQLAFLAGYIAALTTPEYRIGLIGVEDNANAGAVNAAFQNGVRFYCGLCLSGIPPFYEYPILISLPAAASEAEWRAIADFLTDRFVRTVYVVPGAGGAWNEALLRYLAERGVYLIGAEQPPANLQDWWMVSIRPPDLQQVYLEYWPRLIQDEPGFVLPLPAGLVDVNEELLSPGKRRLVEELLLDLQAGRIDTGATPAAP